MLWSVEFAGQGFWLSWWVLDPVLVVFGVVVGAGGVGGWFCANPGRFIGPISFWLGTRTLWRRHWGTYAGVAVDVL